MPKKIAIAHHTRKAGKAYHHKLDLTCDEYMLATNAIAAGLGVLRMEANDYDIEGKTVLAQLRRDQVNIVNQFVHKLIDAHEPLKHYCQSTLGP